MSDKDMDVRDLNNAKETVLDVATKEREEEKTMREAIMTATGSLQIKGGIFDGKDHSDIELQYGSDKNIDILEGLTNIANDLDYSQELRESATALLLTAYKEEEHTVFSSDSGHAYQDKSTCFVSPSDALDKLYEARDLIDSDSVEKIIIPTHIVYKEVELDKDSTPISETVTKENFNYGEVEINTIPDKQVRELTNFLGRGGALLDDKINEWNRQAGHEIRTNSELKNYSDADREVMHGKISKENTLRANIVYEFKGTEEKEIGNVDSKNAFYIANHDAPTTMPFSGQEYRFSVSLDSQGDRVMLDISRDVKDAYTVDKAFDKDERFSSFTRNGIETLHVATDRDNLGVFIDKLIDVYKELDKNVDKDIEREPERELEISR
jgi:hypothetical protein